MARLWVQAQGVTEDHYVQAWSALVGTGLEAKVRVAGKHWKYRTEPLVALGDTIEVVDRTMVTVGNLLPGQIAVLVRRVGITYIRQMEEVRTTIQPDAPAEITDLVRRVARLAVLYRVWDVARSQCDLSEASVETDPVQAELRSATLRVFATVEDDAGLVCLASRDAGALRKLQAIAHSAGALVREEA